MSRQRTVERDDREAGAQARRQLLADAPVTERRLELAGVSTAVLEGGAGPPVVLLHGQGGWAGVWLPAIAGLARTRHVVAPDLPGLGASRATQGPPGAETALAWLGELIDRTCASPPVVVGVSLGGSLAVRFAAAHRDRLAGLVLVSTGSLVGKVRLRPGVAAGPDPLTAPGRASAPASRCCRQVSVDVERARAAHGCALGAVPGLLPGARPLARRAGGQPPPAARARPAAGPAGGPRRPGRPDHPHLGAPGPGDAAGERPGGRRPLRLGPARDRRCRPLRGIDQPEAFLQALLAALGP